MIKRLMIVIVGLLLAPSMVFANGLLDDLQRYYTFDSTNTDEQGNYNAVDVGSISYDTGNAKIGSASLLYNGQTEGKQVGGLNTDIHGGTKEFTYNFWVELDAVNLAASYDDWIINDWMPMATSQSDFLIAVRNGNWGILGSDNTGVAALQLDGDSASTNWDMITVFRNSTHIGISVNGGTPVTQAYTNTIDTNIANAGLGTSAAYNLLGNLDEVGMWTRALNSTQISDLYNGGSGLAYSNFTASPYDPSNLNTNAYIYYAMEDASGNIVDSVGNYDGVVTSPSTPLYQQTGKIDYGLGFDGTTTREVVTDISIPNAQSVYSYCIWLNTDDTANWRRAWSSMVATNGAGHLLQIGGSGIWAGKFRWTAYYSGIKFDAISTTSPSTNTWYHVCGASDGSTAKLYVDGTEEASVSISSATGGPNAWPLTLGLRPDSNTEKWDGELDEFVFFDGYTMTQNDVSFLYASGSPTSNQQYTFSSSAPNTPPTITPIADQSMNEDTTLNVTSAFTIGDAEDPISALTLSYSGYNTSLLNTTSISFDVNTTTGVVDMSITPLPDAYGVTNVTINVTDSSAGTNSSTFELTIFNVNDAPTITPIADQTTTEGATLVINFNVTDVDNPYTDLTYTATAGDVSLIDSATFSNYDGTNQTLTLVAGDYGVTDINVTVQDLQPAQASTQFQYLVNCNTTANYYTPMNVTMQINQGTTDPVVCLSQTFNYNVGSDILTYQWYDFGATMTDIELYVYDSTGGFRRLLNQTTLSTDNGTQTFDYSAINPHYDLLVIAELTDSTRSPFVGGSPARILESTVNQKGQLGSLFSDADGIIYGVLILLLFLTIGIASQSATLTLIFSVLGLFIASKFVLKIPSEFIWITGALVVILLYLIAKLRTD